MTRPINDAQTAVSVIADADNAVLHSRSAGRHDRFRLSGYLMVASERYDGPQMKSSTMLVK